MIPARPACGEMASSIVMTLAWNWHGFYSVVSCVHVTPESECDNANRVEYATAVLKCANVRK
jgi:hypothetical protein